MGDTEALMWLAERDPALRSSFLSVTILDQIPDFARFSRRIANAVLEIPRLRQRVVDPPLGIGPPLWAEDPDFDLSYHVRRLALPRPGTDRQLLDLAALMYQDPFDVMRPLWQFAIVEGLEGGRAGLLAKMHHTISDGVGAIRLSAHFIDLERDSPDPVPNGGVGAPRANTRSSGRHQPLALLYDLAAEALRVPLDLTRRTLSGAVHSVTHPLAVPREAAGIAGAARSALSQIMINEPAHSPLWSGRRSMGRHFEIFSLDLDQARAAAHAMGGTLNDLYVAGVVGGAGAYHRAHSAPVAELRATIPISTRRDRSAGGNSFLPARVLLPAGIEDPAEQFAAVHARLAALKGQRSAGIVTALASLLATLPPGVILRIARSQVGTVDFAASNVRGAPFDLYVGGARILANHPIGPTAGTAFNATLMSSGSHLDVGLNIDPAAVTDPEQLRACVVESIEGLVAAGS
jgi:diacylglycerol O-acyltransferase